MESATTRSPQTQWPTAAEDPAARALAGVAMLPAGHPDRRRVRDQVVCDHLSLARQVANRFANRGEPWDDLYQAATVALLNAAERFDGSHGVSFAGYAIPTMMGELRHHFRDRTWSLRVDRRLQELHLRVRQATEDLAQVLGREPSYADIAGHLDVDVEEVRQAAAVGQAYRARSLNMPVGPVEAETELGDVLPVDDPDLESVADRFAVLQLVSGLSENEQRLLCLRFAANQTQAQIAEVLGVSQMQVSRLLSAVLRRLREALLADDPGAGGPDTPAERT